MRLSGLLAVGMAASAMAIPALTTLTVTVIVNQTSTLPGDMTATTTPSDMTMTTPLDLSTTIANVTETMTATTTATRTRAMSKPHWSLPSDMSWDWTSFFGHHSSSFSYGYHTSVWSSVTQLSSGYGYHSPSTTSSYGYSAPRPSSSLTRPTTTSGTPTTTMTSSHTETATPSSVPGTCEELHPEDPKYCHGVEDAYNRHRRNHTVPEMHWNQTLYDKALTIANTCNFSHQDANFGDGGPWVSQNLVSGFKPANIEWGLSDIYNGEFGQLKDEDYGNPNAPLSHLTAMVWKDSITVGCATVLCYNMTCTPHDGAKDCYLNPFQNTWWTVCHHFPGGKLGLTRIRQLLHPPLRPVLFSAGNIPGLYSANLNRSRGDPTVEVDFGDTTDY
ncbi:uncharacterized protein K452DRAFT_355501 [Aplosporella prunicola CBS 121167]|uniref:SCP domain-containing protein n=1 Tax=Aplosporella prunicola CBS 121167 TaxID=1176127 RepID=A0A6A6BRV6_9PEZI|nr:uncharacterized protein K452DRAFT_355501 [Aplosporella prunicola CBS 121167]KAF2146025.1 hypothetical protein K452DRAFT_355501 [Aplosporella prunicola CBS 121167]